MLCLGVTSVQWGKVGIFLLNSYQSTFTVWNGVITPSESESKVYSSTAIDSDQEHERGSGLWLLVWDFSTCTTTALKNDVLSVTTELGAVPSFRKKINLFLSYLLWGCSVEMSVAIWGFACYYPPLQRNPPRNPLLLLVHSRRVECRFRAWLKRFLMTKNFKPSPLTKMFSALVIYMHVLLQLRFDQLHQGAEGCWSHLFCHCHRELVNSNCLSY